MMLKQLYPALLTCDHVIRDIARKNDQNERQRVLLDEKTPVIYKLYYSQYNSLQKLSITSKDTSKWNNLLSRVVILFIPALARQLTSGACFAL